MLYFNDLVEYGYGSKYPGWPHRQFVGLAYPWTCVRAPIASTILTICRPSLHLAIPGAQGVLPTRVGDATSQLDLPSLTPLSVAGCGRL